MLKKILSLITLLFCLFNLNAQEKYNIKLGIEIGMLPLAENSENLGLFLYVEPKIKILKNTFIGWRLGVTLNSYTFENNDSFQFSIDEKSDHAVISLVPTFDYYLKEYKNFRPYVGLGLGIHLLADPIDVFRIVNPSEEILEGNVNNRIGFLFRGGCELGKIRLGLEYNYLPKANIEIPNGQIIGTVDNSYFGVSIGLIIGVGKSSK